MTKGHISLIISVFLSIVRSVMYLIRCFEVLGKLSCQTAYIYVCVRVWVRACVRACVCVSICVFQIHFNGLMKYFSRMQIFVVYKYISYSFGYHCIFIVL